MVGKQGTASSKGCRRVRSWRNEALTWHLCGETQRKNTENLRQDSNGLRSEIITRDLPKTKHDVRQDVSYFSIDNARVIYTKKV